MNRKRSGDKYAEFNERVAYKDHLSSIIESAEKKGEFDDLPGKGKPLKLEKSYFNSYEKQLNKTLKDNNILPKWVQLSKEIETLKNDLDTFEGKDRKKLVKQINNKTREHNLQCPPSVQKMTVE